MDEKGRETITAFDALLTTNHIQMMKVILTYLDPRQQSYLAVYIKFSELQYAMQLLKRSPATPIFRGHRTILTMQSLMDGSLFQNDAQGILELLDELLPFSSPRERAQILNIKNLLTSMGRIREMMEMMEMMKELFPEGTDGAGGAGFGDIFSGMDGFDPGAMFQMFQMLNPAQKESTHETD